MRGAGASRRGRRTVLLDRLLLVLLALLAWQGLSYAAGELALASPLATARELGAMLAGTELRGDFAETAGAVARAACLSVGGGIALGAALATSRRAAGIAEPLLVGFYSLPKLTFYPVILLLFGLGLSAKVALGALHGVIPVALFTLTGMRTVPPVQRQAAQVMGLGTAATVTRVLIPAALPEILAGVRLGLALTLLGTLVGEMFASQAGIGHALKQAMSRADSAAITALAALVFLAAVLLDQAFLRLARGLGPGGLLHRRLQGGA